jgi:hypothetical protein
MVRLAAVVVTPIARDCGLLARGQHAMLRREAGHTHGFGTVVTASGERIPDVRYELTEWQEIAEIGDEEIEGAHQLEGEVEFAGAYDREGEVLTLVCEDGTSLRLILFDVDGDLGRVKPAS